MIYFIKLTKVRLPSVTPSNKTFKSFSSNIISADSLAISTAVSTETPTSEFVSEGLSLIPSPIYPTIFPASFNILTILAFCIGDNFAKILVFFNNLKTAMSVNLSSLLPNTIFLEFIPTFEQTHRVTSALSPVNTITRIPAWFNFSIDSFADSFGGSKKPINPKRIIFFSSLTSKCSIFSISFFWHTATTLKPCSFNPLEIFKIFSLMSLFIGETSPL